MRVIEKNKKDSSVQIKEGTIYISAESIVFKPGAFMVYADQQIQDSSVKNDKYEAKKSIHIFNKMVKNITFPR